MTVVNPSRPAVGWESSTLSDPPFCRYQSGIPCAPTPRNIREPREFHTDQNVLRRGWPATPRTFRLPACGWRFGRCDRSGRRWGERRTGATAEDLGEESGTTRNTPKPQGEQAEMHQLNQPPPQHQQKQKTTSQQLRQATKTIRSSQC